MKKKKQQTLEPPSATAAPPSNTAIDMKSLIHDHALFFDKLVELIPAKFYLASDEPKPWFQGLSKAAKASAKQQTRENIKKARRDRLDPDKSQTTTLDILKMSIEKENAGDSEEDGEDEEEEEEEEEEEIEFRPIKGLGGGEEGGGGDNTKSVTYEELQERLQSKLVELRSNRGEGKRSKMKRGEIPGKDRKRSREFGDRSVKDGKFKKPKLAVVEKEVEEASKGIEFGKLKLSSEDESAMKKRKGLSKMKELERAKKLEKAKSDPERGEIVAKKHSWDAATSRAMGIKVHDDPRLLSKSIHKDKKRREKNVSKWKDRVETREKLKEEKQQKRAGNIADRIHQKKMRKIEKREKKLMRPGFEGRKEGYLGRDN